MRVAIRILPRIFDRQTNIMSDHEIYRRLNVTNRASISIDDRHTPLLTRHGQGGIPVARADGPVAEDEAFKVGRLHRPGLIGTPVTIELVGLNVLRAISRWAGNWVACRSRRYERQR